MKYNNIAMSKPELFEKKLSILQEISSAIVVTDNINSIANLLLDLAVSFCNAEKGSLMLANGRGELYILTAKGMDVQFVSTYRVKIGEGIAGSVARDLSPVLVEDIEKDERFRAKKRDRYKTKSFISCPIVSKSKLLGVLNINDKKDGTLFLSDELELLKIIANHAAIALENALLMTQLKTKAAELEELNKKLIESDVMKTEFIARISHEFRTPLNSIKGAIYYLLQTEDISRIDRNEFYDIISKESGSLITIVENLLNFLRTEDETKLIKKTVINIDDVLRGILESKSLKTFLTRKNITLKINSTSTISEIVGDKILISQFFINLIEGVCQYLERGDSIQIDAEDNEYVRVKVGLPRTMPDKMISYLNENKCFFHTDHREELLKLSLARNVVDIQKWELHGENVDSMFQVTLSIPKSIKLMTEAYINTSMDLFVDFISELLDLDICSIMLSDELSNELTIKGARGLDDNIIKRTRIKVGDRIAGWVALEGKPLLIEDLESDDRFGKKSIAQYTTNSLLSVPIKMENRTIGVLNLNNKKTSEPFTKRDYYLASAMSERISGFLSLLHSGKYTENELKKFTGTFESLLGAHKKYHKKKNILPEMVNAIMDKFGSSEEEKQIAFYISMVYDLGLMLIDERIMNKKKLQSSDARTLKVHPYNTINLLSSFEFSEDVKKIILHHHERYDGTGYPDGLKGEDIPFISRVLSVVDSFCAMTSDRTYREKKSKERALKEIRKDSGSKYDPNIVKAFEGVIDLYY